MGMFSNYEDLADNYVPNNLRPNPPKCDYKSNCNLEPCKPNKPYEEYNAEGQLIGYFWYYGNSVNLEFNINGEVTYEGSEDYITAKDFLSDKLATIKLYNFRREEIVEKVYDLSTLPDPTSVTFVIDEGLSKKLVKGVYYITLTISDKTGFNTTIFYQEDCNLFVK